MTSKKKRKVEMRSVDELAANPRNPRKHSSKQIKGIAASIRDFGWLFPILIEKDGTIIAGHGRLEAAKLLKQKTVPTMTTSLKGLDSILYLLLDNQSVQRSSWSRPQLVDLFIDLDEVNYDLKKTGFDIEEIKNMIHAADEAVAQAQRHGVHVKLESETDQEQAFELFKGQGYECRLLTI